MRLDDFRHFVADEFISELHKSKAKKDDLLSQLSEISELPGLSNETGIRGSGVSDPTASSASKRIKILAEIESIEECERAYDYAMSKLDPEERELIEDFTDPYSIKWKVCEKWKRKLYVSDTTLYEIRKKILVKIGESIDNHWNLG